MNNYSNYTDAAMVTLVEDYKWLSLQSHASLMELASELSKRLQRANYSLEETIDGYLDRKR